MKSTLNLLLLTTVAGLGVGAALGYWEARPWDLGQPAERSSPPTKDSSGVDDSAGRPRAVVAETSYSFGNMEVGSSQSHAFEIENRGQAPLQVIYVTHTCKCTNVSLGGRDVQPNDSVVVPP